MFSKKSGFILGLALVSYIVFVSESSNAMQQTQNPIIREAIDSDFDQIYQIFSSIIKNGDTYVFDPKTTLEEAKEYWMKKGIFTFVAILDNEIVGTYIIKPNQIGLGSHVANAGYMVDPKCQGKGIGHAMAIHSLEQAKQLGFKAMQFNMVVSTNTHAVNLWKKIGFNIVGTLPKVFNHQQLGYVDAYVMHRFLE